MHQEQADLELPGYQQFWNSAEKKGYSGTAVFTRVPPLNVTYGIGMAEHDSEGRVITVEYEPFYLVNCYTPNAQRELARLEYRMKWEDDFRAYLMSLDAKKPVVLCGGFVDTFRALYPDVTGAYTWWSYLRRARDTNAGWRIDYFIVSERLRGAVHDSRIRADVMGSDHCPVELDLL